MSDPSSSVHQQHHAQAWAMDLPAGHPPVRALPPHSHARGGCPFSAKHEYCAPQKDDVRSPCPALNTLANHGFIPRNGKDISAMDIVRGLKAAYNLSTPLAYVLSFGGWILIHRYNLFSKITLHDIARHNRVEHDASLVHRDTEVGTNYASPEIVEEWIKDLCQDARIQQALDEAGVPFKGVKPEDVGRVLGAEPASLDLDAAPVSREELVEDNGQEIVVPPATSVDAERQPSPAPSHLSELSTSSSHSAGSHGASLFGSQHDRYATTSTAFTTPATSPLEPKFPTWKSTRPAGPFPILETELVASPSEIAPPTQILFANSLTSSPAHAQTQPLPSAAQASRVPALSPKGFRSLLTARGVGRARVRREKLSMPLDALHAEIARGEMAIMLGMWNVRVLPEPQIGGESMFPGEGNRLGSAESAAELSSLKPPFSTRVSKGLKKIFAPGPSTKGKSPSLPTSASAPASLEFSEGVPLEWAADWFKYERIPTGWRPDHKQTLRDTVKRSKQIRVFMDDLRKEEANEADAVLCAQEGSTVAGAGATVLIGDKQRVIDVEAEERASAERQARMESERVLGLGREF
ncbi:hypothetical protein HGRIS_008984 [Hohenbuehelia grisea]|uniref:Heme haloperoxidase family profile domain-containing protein n=1 Tax=Hohenbuehelia grisea TaxID=104357 RepID=A0ABR3IZW0_9AGAR